MMITILAAAMTASMLIATIAALHHESRRDAGRPDTSDKGFSV